MVLSKSGADGVNVIAFGAESDVVPATVPPTELSVITLPSGAVADNALLNVATTVVVTGTWIVLFAGEIEVTNGGVRSAVVKWIACGTINCRPKTSVTW